jgi:hypothetical protein
MYASNGVFGEKWAAELTEATLALATRHGVHGTSVDQELELWHTFQRAARKPKADCAQVSPACRDHIAAKLTDDVYGVILRRGFEGSFLDLRLDLWNTMRREALSA